jgi:hypothetical protein
MVRRKILFVSCIFFKLFYCQLELVEGGILYKRSTVPILTRVRQAHPDTLLKLNFLFTQTKNVKVFYCQPELVEGGFRLLYRVQQAHPDTLLKLNFLFTQTKNVKVFYCQPELVEGGALNKRSSFLRLTRLRQAQTDNF